MAATPDVPAPMRTLAARMKDVRAGPRSPGWIGGTPGAAHIEVQRDRARGLHDPTLILPRNYCGSWPHLVGAGHIGHAGHQASVLRAPSLPNRALKLTSTPV